MRTYEEALANDQIGLIVECLYYFGLIEELKVEPQKAMSFYKQASDICRHNNLKECLVKTLNKRGNIYSESGKIHAAINMYMEILQITKENEELVEYQVKLLNNIGLMYIEVNDYESALKYIYNCIELAKEQDYKLTLTTAYSNLSEIYCRKNNFLKGKNYNRLSSEISTLIEDNIGVAIAIANEGTILAQEDKNWNKAKLLFEKAINLISFENSEIDKEKILLDYGSQAYHCGEYDVAINILKDLAKNACKNTYFNIEIRALKILKTLYFEKKDYKNSYIVTNRLLELSEESYTQWKEQIVENIHINKDSNDVEKPYGMEKSIKTLKSLSEVGRKITSCKTDRDIYEVLKEEVIKIIGCDAFGVGITSENGLEIDYKFFDENGFKETDISIYNDDYLMSICIRYGKDIIVYDTKDNVYNEANFSGKLLYVIKHANSRAIIFCPIKYEDKTIGGITIQTYRRGMLSYVDLESIRILGSYIAIAYSNLNHAKELIIANKKLEEISLLDGLTSVYNRHALGRYMNEEFGDMLNTKSFAAALMIDIDFLKQYNDNYGHVKGDQCIKKVCRALKNSLSRHKYKLFRYGGDEFFAIVEDSNEEEIRLLLDKIQHGIKELDIEHTHSIISDNVTLTIGATIIASIISDYTNIFINADEALYIAKDRGRNQYFINVTT